MKKSQITFTKLLGVSFVIQGILYLASLKYDFKVIKFFQSESDIFRDLLTNVAFAGAGYRDSTYQLTTGPGYLIYNLIYKYLIIFGISNISIALVMFIEVVIYYNLIFKLSKNRKIAFYFTLSSPVIFAFFRGHISIILAILIGYSIIKIREKKYTTASILISIAAGLNYPFLIFSLIFIIIRKFWIFFQTIILTFIFTYLPYFFSYDNKNFRQAFEISNTINKGYFEAYVISDSGSFVNNSIYGLIKPVFMIVMQHNFIENSDRLEKIRSFSEFYIFILILLITLITLFYAYYSRKFIFFIKNNNVIEEIFLLLSIVMLLFPYVTADYKIVVFIIAMANIYGEKSEFLSSNIYILVSLLLLPKYILFWTTPWDKTPITIGSVLNPIILIILLFLVLKFIAKENRSEAMKL